MRDVTITNKLALVVGLVAQKHPDESVRIEWRDTEDEAVWFLTASDGKNDSVYIADDEAGHWAPMNEGDLAKYHAGETVFDLAAVVGQPITEAEMHELLPE